MRARSLPQKFLHYKEISLDRKPIVTSRRVFGLALLASVLGAGVAAGSVAPPRIVPPTPTTLPPPATPLPATPRPLPTPPPSPTMTRVAQPTRVALPLPPTATSVPTIQDVVQTVVGRHVGTIGVYVKHLGRDATASLNADQKLRSASLYKLWVLFSAFSRVQSGELSHDEVIALSHNAFLIDPYNEWPEGTQTPVDCAIKAMVTVSSNSSAEMLSERVGGSARITADAQTFGAQQTEITDDLAFTSPADVGRWLEDLAARRLVGPAASDAMLQLLLAQQINDRLPLPLPLNVQVAHKTGELVNLRNDAGIVYAPSGPYVFVAMVSDAPSEADAAATIVDLSREVYAFFEGGELPSYEGLPPRLGVSVFQVPDAQGRLKPLWDTLGQTMAVEPKGVALTSDARDVRVQQPVVADLQALQTAASSAGVPFWVSAGYRQPRGIDWSKEIHGPSLGCKVTLPTPTPGEPPPTPVPTPGPSPTPQPPPGATQHWLGTVVTVSDNPDHNSSADYATSDVGRWLLANAWQYGFIPALAESPAGQAVGYEPWDLRWVGRVMAKGLYDQHLLTSAPGYTGGVTAALAKAEQDLAAQAGPG